MRQVLWLILLQLVVQHDEVFGLGSAVVTGKGVLEEVVEEESEEGYGGEAEFYLDGVYCALHPHCSTLPIHTPQNTQFTHLYDLPEAESFQIFLIEQEGVEFYVFIEVVQKVCVER